MDLTSNNLHTLCEEINSVLELGQVRPEDSGARMRLLQPLEEAVVSLSEAPPLSDNPAGKIAVLLWFKNHPERADMERLFDLLNDDASLVRLSVTDAVAATLKASHQRWSEPQFCYLAREALLRRREVETSPVITYNLNEIATKLIKTARPRKQKRPKLILNPYVAGLPVQGHGRFFGRRDILKEIETSLGRREGTKSIVLCGARRTGKTSILYEIKQGALEDTFLPVYIDMQAIASNSLPYFLQTLLLSIETAAREHKQLQTLDLSELKNQQGHFPTIQQFFRMILSELKDTTLLLMIDEYELLREFFEHSSLDRQIMAALEQEPRLYFIFAGSQKIESLKHKGFLNLVDNSRYIKISFLEREEALQLIEEPARGLIEYAKDVPELILKCTAGHPFYTQLLCQSLFDLVKTGGTATAEHVQQTIRQFLRNPSPHLILTWNGLDLEQKVVGSTLAELSLDGSFKEPLEIIRRLKQEKYPVKLRKGEVQQSLNILRDIDWVEKEEGVQAYRYTMDLVRRWIVENRSIPDLIEEQRTRLFSKVADFWRQLLAWVVDLGIFSAIVALLWGIITNASADVNRWWLFSVAVSSIFYFMLPPLIAKSTLGLHLFNLHIVSPLAGPLSRGRALLYGFMSMLRFVVMLSLVWKLLAVLNPQTFSLLNLLEFIVTAILTSLDILLVFFGKKHQGLYDMLAGTLIISAVPAED